MSDFVKTVAITVGQIAAAAGGYILGGPLGAAIASTLFSLGASALLRNSPSRQAQELRIKIGETPRKAIFGRAATAGDLADAFNYGGKSKTDWEVLVIDLADHECDAIEGYWLDDKYFAWPGNGTQPAVGEGQLWMWFLPGTESQTVPSILVDHGGWSADDRGRGLCRMVVAYKADSSDEKAPELPTRPTFLFVLRGAKLYDLRKDSTVAGGSGLHRWNDPSTWEWTDNAEICRDNYDRGIYACNRVDQPDQLLIGRGLAPEQIPADSVIAAANVCDEDVALAAGGSEKRYRASGVVSAAESFGEVEEAFAAAMGGVVIQPEGGIGVDPGMAKPVVAEITDDDLIVGTAREFEDYRGEADQQWVNTVAARYVEPDQKWADHGCPVRRVSADVTADAGQRLATPTLRFVTSGTQAQRVAEIIRRLGRLLKTGKIVLGPRFAHLEEGDWIGWTSARYLKGARVVFRIESYSLDQKWQNTLALREIAANVFIWSTADEIADGTTAEAQTPPDQYAAPESGSWALSATSEGEGGQSVPAAAFTGAVDDPYAAQIQFEVRVYDAGATEDENWERAVLAPVSTTVQMISGLAPLTDYEGAVSFRYGAGVASERLILGPVTMPANGETANLVINSYPVGAALSASDATADVSIGAHTRRYPDKDVSVDAGSITGLSFETGYYVGYEDAARAGGSVTYAAYATAADAGPSPAHPYRHFVGFIQTPVSGGGDVDGEPGAPPWWKIE
ncbi:phage tail protein [Stakelama tenebrarum]|uniref:Tip attachment protein J domain-containing protein n=1 Tax=Stakelama tenebrarum TaxID=2711215 RepID=A0A6G6Y502_9SPHN|nr:phage tail protein [Sphingosinithalassobacter tenebrarum]QIG79995.1 hypothetical protein G5C33_09545 [Sphingosinithalassobacter tenebrarum]